MPCEAGLQSLALGGGRFGTDFICCSVTCWNLNLAGNLILLNPLVAAIRSILMLKILVVLCPGASTQGKLPLLPNAASC
jgi:hypothetical protein